MLDVDAPRVRARQVADQLFERRRILEWILLEDFERRLGFGSEPGCRQLLRVFLRLLREDELPAYQASFFDSLRTGVLSPARMDSRIPGIDSR